MAKKLFIAFNQFFQCAKMIPECFFTGCCSTIGSVGFPAQKAFFNRYVIAFFKRGNMRGKVAICHLQQVFHGIEINYVMHHQQRHDAQPLPAFKCFINQCDNLFHRSYLKYMIAP